MEQLLGLAVTARRPAVRQMASQAVIGFLLTYPLAPAKASAFVQQSVRNLGYEYEEGRAAAVSVVQALAGR